MGLAADMLPKIFNLFTQVDRSLERSQGGLGIGLTLVKRLVEMHGGTVQACSDGPGKGSEFVVCLPQLVEERTPAARSGPAVTESSGSRRHRILVVDDNRDSGISLGMLLRLSGHEVEVAYDGEEALRTSEAFRPGVIFLDLGMPRLSGYEVASRLRAHSWGERIQLIALTGFGQEEDRRKSKVAGFDHHLTKPIELAELRSLLSALPSQ